MLPESSPKNLGSWSPSSNPSPSSPMSPVDPFSPKLVVADPNRRDRQIETLVEPAVIADFYDFGPILGSGGFGEVKGILHAKTFQPFAGKLLQKSNLIEDTVGAAAALKDSTSVDNAADITEASFRRTIETPGLV